MVEGDPHRFERLAQRIADIPIGDHKNLTSTAAETGLRPAMRVEVLDPHALWDARDAMIQQSVERAGPPMVEAAAPVVAQTVVDQVEVRLAESRARADAMRPALAVKDERRTIQLGAYSSEKAARAAWHTFTGGKAHDILSGLQPRFEQAEVNGRSVVRLKVSTPSDSVETLCRTTRIDAPWCVSVA